MLTYPLPKEGGVKMVVQHTETTETRETTAECRHHWEIEPASNPVSMGKCRRCGLEKEFKNYLEETPWGEEVPPPRVAPETPFPIAVSDDEEME